MKRLLGTILALSILAMAAAQSEVQFEIQVDPIMAIALGADATGDVLISYALDGSEGEFVSMTSTSFELRYITNRVDGSVMISQEQCDLVWDDDEGVVEDCGNPPLTATVGQFLPSYITIAAGGWGDDGLYEVAAFDEALKLQVTTAAEQCDTTALANSFALHEGFDAYTRTINVLGEDVSRTWDAVDFSDDQKAWAASNLGASQAADGFEIAFNGDTSYLIGNPANADSLIRGAVCGEVAGEGWDITLEPVRVGDTILPAGTTPVAVQITIHDLDDL